MRPSTSLGKPNHRKHCSRVEITEPSSPGNNWMLFDEWTVEVSHMPEVAAEFSFDPGSDELRMNWAIDELGFTYQIEKSSDLSTWETVEKVSPEARGKSGVTLNIKDPYCFYRLKRIVSLSRPSE